MERPHLKAEVCNIHISSLSATSALPSDCVVMSSRVVVLSKGSIKGDILWPDNKHLFDTQDKGKYA